MAGQGYTEDFGTSMVGVECGNNYSTNQVNPKAVACISVRATSSGCSNRIVSITKQIPIYAKIELTA